MKQWIRTGSVLLIGTLLLSGCMTPLQSAAWSGNTIEVQRLLDQGVDVNARDADGKTALMRAAEAGHTDCIRLLLERGADINALPSAPTARKF